MFARLLLLSVALWLVGGCGKMKQAGDRARVTNDLKQLGMAYIAYQDTNQKPPKSYQELATYSQKMGDPLSAGIASLNVTWGAGMAYLCRDGAAAEVVVAHGPVADVVPALFADGSVRSLTKAEFDSAKKATVLTR